jgi:hypothetical protein
VNVNQCFGGRYCLDLLGPRLVIQKHHHFAAFFMLASYLAYFSTLKMGTISAFIFVACILLRIFDYEYWWIHEYLLSIISSSETLVDFHQTTPCYISADWSLQSLTWEPQMQHNQISICNNNKKQSNLLPVAKKAGHEILPNSSISIPNSGAIGTRLTQQIFWR